MQELVLFILSFLLILVIYELFIVSKAKKNEKSKKENKQPAEVKYLISKYQTNNGQYGYNVSEGGEGNSSRPSEESNKKRSESEKGEKHWHYGQKWNEEIKQKMRKPHYSIRGNNNPAKRQEVKDKISSSLKQWHKDHPDIKFDTSHICTQQMKYKISQANQGENNGNYNKHWYNNGEIEILTFECPNGFVKGRLRRK